MTSYEIVPESMFPKLPYTKNEDVRRAVNHLLARPDDRVRVQIDGRTRLQACAYAMAERRRMTIATTINHGWLYIWRVSATPAQSRRVVK